VTQGGTDVESGVSDRGYEVAEEGENPTQKRALSSTAAFGSARHGKNFPGVPIRTSRGYRFPKSGYENGTREKYESVPPENFLPARHSYDDPPGENAVSFCHHQQGFFALSWWAGSHFRRRRADGRKGPCLTRNVAFTPLACHVLSGVQETPRRQVRPPSRSRAASPETRFGLDAFR
jgi:hypothetical protein